VARIFCTGTSIISQLSISSWGEMVQPRDLVSMVCPSVCQRDQSSPPARCDKISWGATMYSQAWSTYSYTSKFLLHWWMPPNAPIYACLYSPTFQDDFLGNHLSVLFRTAEPSKLHDDMRPTTLRPAIRPLFNDFLFFIRKFWIWSEGVQVITIIHYC